MIPAEIWRRNAQYATKLLIRKKQIVSIDVDNAHQTADADYSNNSFPARIRPSRLEIYKSKRDKSNLMANLLVELDKDKAKKNNAKKVPLSGKR